MVSELKCTSDEKLVSAFVLARVRIITQGSSLGRECIRWTVLSAFFLLNAEFAHCQRPFDAVQLVTPAFHCGLFDARGCNHLT